MDGLHGVRSLVQRPDELEVEDAADQAADTARREEDHLKGNRGREMVRVPPGLQLHRGAPAGRWVEQCASAKTNVIYSEGSESLLKGLCDGCSRVDGKYAGLRRASAFYSQS